MKRRIIATLLGISLLTLLIGCNDVNHSSLQHKNETLGENRVSQESEKSVTPQAPSKHENEGKEDLSRKEDNNRDKEGKKSESESEKVVQTDTNAPLEYTSKQQRAIYDALSNGKAERVNNYTELVFYESVGLPVTSEEDAVNTLKAVVDIFNIENFDYVATYQRGPEGEDGYYLQQLYDGVPISSSFFRMYLREDKTLSTVFSGVGTSANKGVKEEPKISKERAIEISGLKNIMDIYYSLSTEYGESYWMIHDMDYNFVMVGAESGKILCQGNDGMID